MKSCPKIPDFPEKNPQDQDVPTLRRSRYFLRHNIIDIAVWLLIPISIMLNY